MAQWLTFHASTAGGEGLISSSEGFHMPHSGVKK